MGVELAVGIDQLALGRADLLAGMDHPAFGAHRADAVGQGADVVHLEFDGGVALPASSVVWIAQATQESSSVAWKPPCTEPIGL
jgi:hypothetical protein